MINKFKFYSNCIPVRGWRHTLIYDLQLKKHKVIPNGVMDVIFHKGESNTATIKEKLEIEDYLKQLGLGFYPEPEDNFPPLELRWDFPTIISNAIIDLRKSTQSELEYLFSILIPLNIPYLQLIVECSTNGNLNVLKDSFSCYQTCAIEIILFGKKCNLEYKELEDVLKIDLIQHESNSLNLFVHQEKNLVLNLQHFTESQIHNTYFNRKLFIDKDGKIKNSPECKESFGLIKDLNKVEQLKEIISSYEFQKYWFVHKNLCEVCKDCEYRHMCIDNRIPIKKKSETWFFQDECNYNPYIAKWKGEEGYLSLAECGVISTNNEFKIDHERIAKINSQLWEE